MNTETIDTTDLREATAKGRDMRAAATKPEDTQDILDRKAFQDIKAEATRLSEKAKLASPGQKGGWGGDDWQEFVQKEWDHYRSVEHAPREPHFSQVAESAKDVPPVKSDEARAEDTEAKRVRRHPRGGGR